MNNVEAIHVLAEAEKTLRHLIIRYTESGEYARAADAALGAERLLAVMADLRGNLGTNSVREPPRATSIRTKYPTFLREGERLVKVGWSKANNEIYEHKAGFAVLRAVRDEILKAAKRVKRVNFSELSIRVGKDEVPSYQAYLCLAWLIDAKLLRKVGRDTYLIDDPDHFDKTVLHAWDQLPNRA